MGSGGKLIGIQRGTAMDGEEVGNRGKIKIHKTGEEKCGSEEID